MTSKTATVVTSVAIGMAVFLVSAVIESFITAWMFKKMGGCPLVNSPKEQLKSVTKKVRTITGRQSKPAMTL